MTIPGAARVKIRQQEDRLLEEARLRDELDKQCAALETHCNAMVARMESMQVCVAAALMRSWQYCTSIYALTP